MNGVRVERQQPLGFARSADVVIVGSGRKTGEIVDDPAIMSELRLDPARQPGVHHRRRRDIVNRLHDLKHAFELQSLEIETYYSKLDGKYFPRQPMLFSSL